jgi:hypothetical protein
MATPDEPTLEDIRTWPATVSVPDAAKAMGISKSYLHALIRNGESPVRTLPCGPNRHRVITASLLRLLEAA